MQKIFATKLNKILAVMLCVLFIWTLICSSFCSFAETSFEAQYTQHACLYNIDYDKFLYQKGMDDEISPAGTVKIMVALLAFEHYPDLSTKIKVTADMVQPADKPSIGFGEGQEYTIEELLCALIITNANDAAFILACSIAGDSGSFLSMMNDRAKELGMANTSYLNITGAHSPSMTTTVSDICTLMKEAYKYSHYIEISSYQTYTIPETSTHAAITLHNRNYFVSTYYNLYYYLQNVTGMSVSSDDTLGDCLALTAQDSSGLSYIVIVMGSVDPEPEKDENGEPIETEEDLTLYAAEDAIDLMTWGFRNFDVFTIVNSGEMICEVPVTLSDEATHVIALPQSKVMALLPKDIDLSTSVRTEYKLNSEKVMAPVVVGQEVGELTVYVNDEVLSTVKLIAKNSVGRSNTSYIFYRIGQMLISPLFIALYVIILLLIIAVAYLRHQNAKRKAKRIRPQ